ncbi:hypothetical protein EIP86_005229, partial [Pleurotus ostreatoroseus]
MNNASANDVLARTLGFLLLKHYGIHFDPQNGQIHCIAHVVNLVVQKMPNKLEEAVDPSVNDYYECNKHVSFHYDSETDEDQKALDEEEDEDEDESSEDKEASGLSPNGGPIGDEDDEPVQQWPNHSAVKKIASSPQRRSSFRKIVHSAYASSHLNDVRRRRLMVIQDVVTRWNYTHTMIERALFMRTVFNNVKLRELLLSQQEWALLKSIAGLLENDTITVETARKTFEDAYKDYQRDVPQPEAPPPAATQVEDHLTDFMDEICSLREPTPDAAKSAEFDDELTRYLSMADGKVVKDDSVLTWWK